MSQAQQLRATAQLTEPGLHQDEHNPQFEPIQVWRDFNHCWLALGQKQKDQTEEAIRYHLSESTVLPAETIIAMIDELIRLCDSVEQHGLVDYDRGVWEEEIVLRRKYLIVGDRHDPAESSFTRNPLLTITHLQCTAFRHFSVSLGARQPRRSEVYYVLRVSTLPSPFNDIVRL